MFDPNDGNIYVVLDEGCNSTCHSRYWGEVVENKLKMLGYEFPFSSKEPKNFAGLGEKGTSTEGSRTLPFSLHFETGKPLHGVLESHQLSKGRSPLLLSLHAQTHLGLVKDLKNGVVSIDGKQLKVYRCIYSGLMMLAVTPQQLVEMSDSSLEGPYIPKCHRSFRTRLAFPAMMDDCNGERGFQASSGAEVTSKIYSLTRRLRRGHFVIVTGGYRFEDRLSCIEDPCPMLQLDATKFHDPEEDVNLRSHTGRRPGIILGLQRDKKTTQAMFNSAEIFCRSYENGVIDLKCRSGRHRSVGSSIVLYRFLRNKGYEVTVVHQHSPEWSSMRCGGRCDQCGPTAPATTAAAPLVLKPAANQTPRATSRTTSSAPAAAAPWRTPPKAPPPKAKARPAPTESNRPSSRTISARPVPEFADDSPGEPDEPQEGVRAVAAEPEAGRNEGHADEANEEAEEEEKTSEEEVEPEEKKKPQDNAEILSALSKLTSAVTTLVERDQKKSSRTVRRSRSRSTSSRRSRKARRSRSARRGRSYEKIRNSRRARESKRGRGSSSSNSRKPLPASSSKRAKNPSPKKKKPVKEPKSDRKATASKSTRTSTTRPTTQRGFHDHQAILLQGTSFYDARSTKNIKEVNLRTSYGTTSAVREFPIQAKWNQNCCSLWWTPLRRGETVTGCSGWSIGTCPQTSSNGRESVWKSKSGQMCTILRSSRPAGWLEMAGSRQCTQGAVQMEHLGNASRWERGHRTMWTYKIHGPTPFVSPIMPLVDTWRCSRAWLKPQSQGFVRLFHQLPQSQRESGTC